MTTIIIKIKKLL